MLLEGTMDLIIIIIYSNWKRQLVKQYGTLLNMKHFIITVVTIVLLEFV